MRDELMALRAAHEEITVYRRALRGILDTRGAERVAKVADDALKDGDAIRAELSAYLSRSRGDSSDGGA